MTRTFFSITGSLALVVLVGGCQARPAESRHRCPTKAAVVALSEPRAGEITLEQLALLLPRRPIVVGFDVDDTLIFSAPAFNALQPEYDADVIRPKSYADLTPEQKAQHHDFWNRLNGQYDDRSVPKEIGRRLLALHVARGDDIWLISKRQSIAPAPAEDVVTRRYERMFGIRLAHPVVQTQLQDKTRYLCERKIAYYYGDADGDITAALAAGAVPIRVKRSPDSYGRDSVHNGQLGEIVLKDSER